MLAHLPPIISLIFLSAGIIAGTPSGATARADATAETRFAIAARCDALIERAVRTPAGIGWVDSGFDRGATKGRHLAWINAPSTAQTGMVLFEAGQMLHEKRFEDAAYDAGRGLISIQIQSGQFRQQAVIAAPRGSTDPPVDVPERRATRLAVALLLTLVNADRPMAGTADVPSTRHWTERLKGPATHGASWLAGQQAAIGLWLSAYPPDAPLGKSGRIIRLDDPEIRDDLCLLLLAGEVLDNAGLRHSADHALDGLMRLRVLDARSNSPFLWVSAYTAEGAAVSKSSALDHGVDLLASQYAVQAILADYLVSLDARANDGLMEATRLIKSLPLSGGRFERYYDFRGQMIPVPPASQPSVFGPTGADVQITPDWMYLEAVLAAAGQIDAIGGKRYADFLAESEPILLRLANQGCGLSDDALGLRLRDDRRPQHARAGVSDDLAEILHLFQETGVKTRP